MSRGAARLDLSQNDVLSQSQAESREKLLQKLDFHQKLRDFQRRGKAERSTIAKFAKKHGFTYKSVWSGLQHLGKRLTKLQQRLETLEKAAKMEKLNGSAIHRSFKRPKTTVRGVNKLLSCERMRRKLEKTRFWRQIQLQMSRDEGEMELTNSEWDQWFEEYRRIVKAVEENRIIPKRELTFFRDEPWVNEVFHRKA